MSFREEFRFRRFDTVGRPDAEEDREFLQDGFIDTGALEVLRDCSNPARLVLGRTGTGKTALLSELETIEERVIRVRPESLALSYISNSTILGFLHQLDVKLDIFFRLLWRHVFTVEIIRTHFRIQSPETKRSTFEHIKAMFHGNRHEQALRYLEEWGQSFWEETDYRIRETTTKLEDQVKSEITAKFPTVSFGVQGAQGLTEEEKVEITQRAQQVVNSVQIRELSEIIDLLARILDDPKQRYYIVIDRLDEDWIEDKLRYLMIRALIETARDFSRVRNGKIIIALREDLLHRVYRLERVMNLAAGVLP